MDFDFLPNLPKPNLDDRTYKDLVDECILRIPRYCPEWTNHNAADPGITLIEMFAWLTDQMLLRFNEVPRRHYISFLELLGIRLQPPAPAHTDITFFLTRPQHPERRIAPVPAGTEVATERTETQAAIVFSTDSALAIGVPTIRHFLTAEHKEQQPQALRDRLANTWSLDAGYWSGRSQFVFQERPQEGNCFYLVFDAGEPLDANILVLTIEGEPAGTTGIDPNQPPRVWEAWDGDAWQPILRHENHDETYGFSFNAGGNQDQGVVRKADVTLYMPLHWPATYFTNYYGRWLRCVYQPTQPVGAAVAPSETNAGQTQPLTNATQYAYSRSPKLTALAARAIGGTVPASQCQLVRRELLGESTGQPGQTFQLHTGSILPRRDGEQILIESPSGPPQLWQEVSDFADSGPDDRHYVLDSVSGEIQFGPLVREPSQLQASMQLRRAVQVNGASSRSPSRTQQQFDLDSLEHQYGAIPARGALVYMLAYRTGGGIQGNVQKGQLRILKTAVPYIARVENYQAARDGANSESLEEAVIRVPQWLRTRDRAVTPEDFETLACQASRSIAHAYCPRRAAADGVVDVYVVPWVDAETTGQRGIEPDQLSLSDPLRTEVLAYLQRRQLLGINVRLQQPDYVGVSIQVEVGVESQYETSQARRTISEALLTRLYRFLNPLDGGLDGKGWPLGKAVYQSDLVGIMQQVKGIRYLGTVQLFAHRWNGRLWQRTLAADGIVYPGEVGVISAWQDSQARIGHVVTLINANRLYEPTNLDV